VCANVPHRPLRRTRRDGGAAAVAIALVIGALAGCGGGGGGTSADTTGAPTSTAAAARPAHEKKGTPAGKRQGSGLSDEQAIRAAVEATLASRDPEQACRTYVTERYVKTAYGGLQGCFRAQAPGSAARFLKSLHARIRGSRATATAIPVGGPYDGATVTASLVLEGGTWRVDALHSNVPVGP
jgi:hypothetical protein